MNESKNTGYKTGCKFLDDLGGIPLGEITEIVGPSGSGKTTFLHQISVYSFLSFKSMGKVAFFDADFTFNSDRLYRLAELLGLDSEKILSNILVFRMSDTVSFFRSVGKMDLSKVNLIIIDSINNLLPIGPELSDDSHEIYKRVMEIGLNLVKIVNKFPQISILVANQVRFVPTRTSKRMAKESKLFGEWTGDIWSDEGLAPSLGIIWEEFIDNRIYLKQGRGNMRIMQIIFSSTWPEVIGLSRMVEGIIFK